MGITIRTSRPGLFSVLAAVVLSLFVTGLAVPTQANAAAADISTMYTQTNSARTAAGLPALKRNTAMDAVAQAWAKKMADAATMSHNPSYSTQIPSGWTRASENVAYGYKSNAVVNGWLNSPGHKANIMGDVTDIGIGYFVDAKGVAWSVQNFAKYAASSAPAPAAPVVNGPTPVIVGNARVGYKLTANVGTWTPAPVSVTFQWKRAGVAIAGATAKTYTLTASDAGKPITVSVTGKKVNHTSRTRTSAPTLAVRGS
jgi:hypothetical protein